MKFTMEYDKSKMTENEAYAKFCVNYVNQIRDKLNYKFEENIFSMDMVIIRKKVEKVKTELQKVPKWNVGKDTPEKVVK